MRTMMRSSNVVVVVVALTALFAHAAEEKIKPDELPKAVSHALSARFPGLKITSAVKETDSPGQVVYDIELTQKGRKFETDIKGDGTMLEVEKEVKEKNWSKALSSTVKAKYPKATIKEVLEVNKVTDGKEVPHHFEVTVETSDKKEAEMLVSLDGKSETEETSVAAAKPAATPAADEDIKPADLPKVVTNALMDKFPKAEIKSAEKGEEDGKPIFEVTIKSDRHSIDVTLSPKGDILSYEKTLSTKELPKAMTKSLNAKYPHASIKVIEEVWENDKRTGYEGTIITTDNKKVAVTFDPKGKLMEGKK